MKKRYMALISVAVMLAASLLGCGSVSDSGVKSETENSTGTELFASSQETSDSPAWVKKIPQAQDPDVSQIFIVAGLGMDKTTATISMHERDESGAWKKVLSTPGYVGKYGLVPDQERREGCGQTPIGTYHLNKAFGIAADPGCAIPYVQADDNTWWSGDSREGMHYNEMVDIKEVPELDTDEREHIVDYQYEYQYCLNISFNEDGTPGRGSAIFLHCLGVVKPYTGGCVAVPEYIMKQIMQRVQPDCVVVIDTLENLTGDEYIGDAFYATDDAAQDGAMAQKSDDITASGADEATYSDDPSDFVLLSEAVSDAILEIRYYSTYNFVGDRIDGYEEPLAFLTKEAASALKEVSDALMEQGYRLKIYDAYRPQMAVTHFMNWALDGDDTRMKEYFYPDLDKDVLFPQGYIAEHSGHSRGSTVDLTLFDMTTEKEVDMGGTFDYFGELSHPDYTEITEEQYANRMLLRDAMLSHGFKPLAEEWWHFTLEDEPYPDTYFTFPINSDSIVGSN